jgi:hypothetical protein
MEKGQLCEASRAPNCSSIVINDDDIAKGECKRAYELGSQCCPNECLFGSGKPQGVGISGRGPDGQARENTGVSLRATQGRGGRILSQQEGFQVSGKGNKWSKGKQGEQGDNHVHNLSTLCI